MRDSPYTNTTVCVYEAGPDFGGMSLYEVRSTDGGVSWSGPLRSPSIAVMSMTPSSPPTRHAREECGCSTPNGVWARSSLSATKTVHGAAVTYPVAVKKIDGVIHLMSRDQNHPPGGKLQIGQMFSEDNGYTWTGHSVFSYNFTQDQQFSFIGSQGGQNVTVLAAKPIGGKVHHWTSWNNGLTWEGPYETTQSTGAADAEFSVGCRGVVFTFTAPFSFKGRRYDWYGSCQ